MRLEIPPHTSIGICTDFLSKEEREYLVNIAQRYSDKNIDFYNELDPKYSFWDRKNIEFSTIDDLDLDLIRDIQGRVENVFRSEYMDDQVDGHRFVQMNNIHRFLEIVIFPMVLCCT
jgi:ethanolamine utilization cobalamin adenosyltransferase